MEDYQIAVILGISGLIAGYACFLLMMKFLPRLEKRENLSQKEEVLREAKRQASVIREDAKKQAEEHEALFHEDLEASVREQQELLKADEDDLEAQEEYYQQELLRIEKAEEALKLREEQVGRTDQQLQTVLGNIEGGKQELIQALSKACDTDAERMASTLRNQITESRQLECQKVIKSLNEELSSSTRKKA